MILYDDSNYVTSAGVPQDCKTELNLLRASSAKLNSVALGSSGQWVVVHDSTQAYTTNLNSAMTVSIQSCVNAGYSITAITLGAAGGSVVLGNQTHPYAQSVPSAMYTQLSAYAGAAIPVSAMTIGPNNDWAIASSDSTPIRAANVPSQLYSDLVLVTGQGLTVHSIAEGYYGDYVIVYGANGYIVHSTTGRATRSVHSSRR